MKVGILTFTGTNNYGAALQAYALNRKIRDMGYDCETLQYDCKSILQRERPKAFSEVKGVKRKLVWLLMAPGQKKKYRSVNGFLAANAAVSCARYSRDNIADANAVYDKFIVGSDIVWETNVTGKDFSYYLDFVSDPEKKYAYAASFGYDAFPADVEQVCTKLLADFSGIAVREDQGQKLLAQVLPQKQVCMVCDPTLLLTADHWNAFAEASIPEKKDDYIFLYFLDPQGKLLAKARELAARYGKKIVVYGDSMKGIPGTTVVRNLTMEQFLTYIRNSFCLLTGSYHGVCFATVFHRSFIFFNRAHPSRILSLVNELGAQDRDLAKHPEVSPEMDYEPIEARLQAFRKRSEAYLARILEGSGDKT